MADDENELAETFRAMDEISKQKRANNRSSSPKVLRDNGIEFSEHNGGAHLVVYGKAVTVDFWPGTGRWTVRNKRLDDVLKKAKTGFGVFNLIKLLKGEK